MDIQLGIARPTSAPLDSRNTVAVYSGKVEIRRLLGTGLNREVLIEVRRVWR